MKRIRPLGDFYVWYCDWCDSTNSTLWTRLESASVCCAACQQKYDLASDGQLLPRISSGLLEAV